jgi:hypothetical protein
VWADDRSQGFTATGPDAWKIFDGWRFYQEHVEQIWAEASNAVQWEPAQ